MRILLYRECSVWLVVAHSTDRKSADGLCAIYSVITHQWTAHQLTEVCCSVCTLSDGVSIITQWITCFDHVCFVWLRRSRGFVSLQWQDLFGRQAGRHHQVSGPRGGWLSGLFPALRVHSRWLGGLCVIKGPSSASTQVWNAAPWRCWSAFVCSTSLSQLGNPGQKVSAAFRGQEHGALFEFNISCGFVYPFLTQASTWDYMHIIYLYRFLLISTGVLFLDTSQTQYIYIYID